MVHVVLLLLVSHRLELVPCWCLKVMHHSWHVLDQGIAMANYDSFLTTEQGGRHLKDQTWFVCVPKDGMLFVPPGSYYCVVYLSTDKVCKKVKDKKDNKVGPCAHCFHVPLAVDSWKAHVGEAQLRAMSTMNKETFDAKDSSSMWTERKPFYTQHFEKWHACFGPCCMKALVFHPRAWVGLLELQD